MPCTIKRLRRFLIGLLLLSLGPCLVLPALAAPPEPQPAETPAEGFYVAPKLRRLFNSHTSYQFGSPVERRLNPLSRLEWPLNSWWGGLEAGYAHPRYSWRLELMSNISNDIENSGKMKDSDWLDPNRPGVKTVYSESSLRLKPSLTLDASVDYSLGQHLPLPKGLDLRPTVGLRYQRYTFLASDVSQVQWDDAKNGWGPAEYVSGEGLWFRQEYLHTYLGLRLSHGFEAPRFLAPKRQVELFLQGDWAYVVGDNRDHHILRGDRITLEHTTGEAWHAVLGVKVPLGEVAHLGLSGDALRIRTSGQHDYFPDPREGEGPNESWDHGVKVWSDQYSLTLSLEIPFNSFLR